VRSVQHVFEWFYSYGAVEPTTGARFFLELPSLHAEMFHLVVDAFAQAFPDSLNLLLLDNSGAHTASQPTLPENVRLLFLPPYCPELNPIERVWRDLKDVVAWLQVADLCPLQAHCHSGFGQLYAKIGHIRQAHTELATTIDLYRAMEMTFRLSRAEAVRAQVGGTGSS
jgi:hypothetical protein